MDAQTTAALRQTMSHHRAGALRAAEDIYLAVLARDPDAFDALHFLGVLRMQQGRHQEAVAHIGQAVNLDAGHGGAWSNLGLALRGAKRLDEALSAYDRALALKPDFPEALNNRGNVLLDLGRAPDALQSLDRAIALRDDYADAHNNRGNALRALGQPVAALASYERAIALRADYPDALNNRGMAFRDMGEPVAAIADFDRALSLAPAHVDALDNRGIALAEQGLAEAALASFEHALRLSPLRAATHFNASLCRLTLGDFEKGWPEHEWRWQDPQLDGQQRFFSQPLWLGREDIAGKTILLHAEQGYGDAIQFCRYAPLVAARGARVLLEAPAALSSLFGSLRGVSEVVASGTPLSVFDMHCPLLSLPLAFGTTLTGIPDDTPYLAAESSRVRYWQQVLAERTGTRIEADIGSRTLPRGRPRIGLAWSGRPQHRNDRNRSIPVTTLLRIVSPAADFVSLQKDTRPADRLALAECPDLIDVSSGLSDFADTAALISTLDLVITVDTSVAHLAGALRKPVWILLPHAADWRWLRHRDDSPWYPSARLFRQTLAGDWTAALDRVRQALDTGDYLSHPTAPT